MSRRITLALSSALILVMALGSAAPAAAAPSKAKEKAERARVVKYWTPKRMANAIPRDFVRKKVKTVVRKNGKRVVKKKYKFVPAQRVRFSAATTGANTPGAPGTGGGGSGTVTGASWTGGGAALNATGKVFFRMGGVNYVCSGAAVNDKSRPGYSLVLTAGHCIYDEANGKFATTWMFAPAYDSNPNGCDAAPHGCFAAEALVVHQGYASSGAFNAQAVKHDWGFAVVGEGSNGGQLDSKVAEFPIRFDAGNAKRTSFGYPAAGKYDGNDLVYCSGPSITDGDYDTLGLLCDMTPGSSGGPWMRSFSMSSKTGLLNSVNSYRNNIPSLSDYMFGPKFGKKTKATYNAARTAVDDRTVN